MADMDTLRLNLDQQAIAEETPGGTIYYSQVCPDKNLDCLKGKYGAETALEIFKIGLEKSGDGPCVGSQDEKGVYVYRSYSQVLDDGKKAMCGLFTKGLAPGQDTRVGIFSGNTIQFISLAFGSYSYSMVPVPLYDTLGEDAMLHIINQCEFEAIMCDKKERVDMLLNHRDELATIKLVIATFSPESSFVQQCSEKGLEIIEWKDLLELGANNVVAEQPCGPSDTMMIQYTSGTTGVPKGAMIPHEGYAMNINCCRYFIGPAFGPGNMTPENTRHLSYLPLAHVMEQVLQGIVFLAGGRVGFWRGSPLTLLEDVQRLQPTFFTSVPRILNRIYDKVMATVKASKIKTFLFNKAMEKKLEALKRGEVRNNTIWDWLVFGKVQKLLGGQVKVIITASAPLSKEVTNFLKCCFGAYFAEGYGQTEACGLISITALNDYNLGHVGCPMPSLTLKLADCPDLGYFAKDGYGEVCAKGVSLMFGYFRNEEKTREAIDEEGWLHTGDIGRINPNGTLSIVDRLKHIFKLSQGEYVAPEQVEGIYIQLPVIAQFFLHGDSLQNNTVGIAVPDPEVLPNWVKEKLGKDVTGSVKELCQNRKVVEAVLQELRKFGEEKKLKKFVQPAAIHLEPEMFSVENGLLTPTMKARRPVLKKHYQQVIDDLYASVNDKQ